VLIGSLFITGTIFAEGEVPVDTPEAEVPVAFVDVEEPAGEAANELPEVEDILPEDPAMDSTALEEAPSEPAEEVVCEDDEGPVEEESLTDDAALQEPEADENTGDESLSDAVDEPDLTEEMNGGDVQLVDGDGEALDLASQESAELMSGGDPYWKVGTQYYSVATTSGGCYPGTSEAAGTCWVNSSPISYALTKIESEGLLPSDRKLYVLEGTYTGDITISGGGYLSQMTGLIGVDGSDNIHIIGDISLENMLGGFTLSGFTITGGVEILDSRGNIVLDDLNISNPNGDGINIHGTWYYYDEVEGYVEIEGPHYSGTVTVTDVNSSGNQGAGAYIWANNTIKVTNSSFNSNGGTDGVDDPVDSLYLDASWGSKLVTLDGVSANDNNGSGIFIEAGGATVKNVIANNNTAPSYAGASEENDWKSYGYGLFVGAGSSTVTIENVIANHNQEAGVEASLWKNALKMKNVEASYNESYGISVWSDGAVTLDIITTHQNSLDGIILAVSKTVKLSSIISTNNGLYGLNITAMDFYIYNPDTGEYDIYGGKNAPTSVIITSSKNSGWAGANRFSENGQGIFIESKGAITISNTDATNNGDYGMYLDNCLKDNETGLCQGNGNITINVTISDWLNDVSINGAGGFMIKSKGNVIISQSLANDNTGIGVWANTWGTITLDRVTANNNTEKGAYLDNWNGLNKSVTLFDSEFSDNEAGGLEVYSRGAITLNGVSANDNLSPTSGDLGSAPVSILDWMGNDLTETWGIWGTGDTVTINLNTDGFYVSLELRDQWGTLIDSSGGASDPSITYTLAEGQYYELIFWNEVGGESGSYTLSVADDDFLNPYFPGSGIILDNSSVKANVTIKDSKLNAYNNFDGNEGFGLKVLSNGNILLTNVSASDNLRTGVSLNNPDASGTVTIQDKTKDPQSFFNSNRWGGVYVRTQGNITIYGVSASDNGSSGMDLDNCIYDDDLGVCLGKGSIKIGGSKSLMNYFDNNNDYGILAFSKNIITVTNVQANQNDWDGLYLDNCLYNDGWGACVGSGAITLTTINADENGGTGVYAFSNSHINLTGISAGSNGDFGVYASDQFPGSTGNISLKSITADNNNNVGISVSTNGMVKVNAVSASENFLRYGYLNSGDAVSEYYNGDVGADYWFFDAEAGVPLTFRLFASDYPDWDINNFLAWLALYDENDNPVAFGSTSGLGTAALTATWTPSTSGTYYLEVSEFNMNNGFYRLSIDNSSFTDMQYLFISGLGINAGKNVTFSGRDSNNYIHNSLTGLGISTPANIILTNIQSRQNGTEGAYLDNYQSGAGYGNVSIAGSTRSNFGNNGWEGLTITSNGTVNLSYVWALFNGRDGIRIGNDDVHTEKNITLKNIDLVGNVGNGILLQSSGKVSMSNVKAQGNGENGLDLDNDDGPGGITISGENYLRDNGGDGLSISTNGTASLSGITAQNNGNSGITVSNWGAGLITLTNINVKGSGEHGIDIFSSSGDVKLTNVCSYMNGIGSDGDGLFVAIDPAHKLTISRSSFMGNEGNGIELLYMGSGGLPPAITSTTYFGNDTDYDGGVTEANFYIHDS